MPSLLQVSELATHYVSFRGERVVKAVDRVTLSLQEGEPLGSVGESGCGKTTTCLSIVGLLPAGAQIVGGRIDFAGQDLAQLSQREMRRVRGAQIAMILQDPMASLNPLFSIYRQVTEPAYYHRALRGRSLRERVRELLNARHHPSTKALIGPMPRLGSTDKRLAIPGQPPDLATVPTGCASHPWCPDALPSCAVEEPGEGRIAGSWTARCVRAEAQ